MRTGIAAVTSSLECDPEGQSESRLQELFVIVSSFLSAHIGCDAKKITGNDTGVLI